MKKLWIPIFCWLVKGVGVALLLLILAIVIGEGPPNPLKMPGKELVLMAMMLIMFGGLGVALWRQLIGGVVLLIGIAGFTIFGGMPSGWVFQLFWLLGFLNILCWWLRRSSKASLKP